jgi:hypothetical protein
MSAPVVNRFEIDEKNAIIALQAILTTRGHVTEEKYQQLEFYLSRLPPHRALLFYGHAMHAIANRLDEDSPYRKSLKKLGQSITEHIGPEFAEQVEADPDFFESQCELLEENLNKIATLMNHLKEKVA